MDDLTKGNDLPEVVSIMNGRLSSLSASVTPGPTSSVSPSGELPNSTAVSDPARNSLTRYSHMRSLPGASEGKSCPPSIHAAAAGSSH